MLRFFSPAKVNFFFRVLKARPDGFHEVATLMQAISLGDSLFLEPAPHDSLTCTDSSLSCDHSNLVLKAARLFREKSKIPIHCKFHLIKRIPIEAGLGGGSSNAATVLWALSHLTGEKIDIELLKKWSAELGSDVPFFFSKGSAYCTGRGEIIQDTEGNPSLSFWIAKPKDRLSTPEVYGKLKLDQLPDRDPLKALEGGHLFNDLEYPAFALNPALTILKEKLLHLGFQTVVMTGSGTAFYCLGAIQEPVLEGVQFYPVDSVQRKEGAWYQ